MRLVAATFALLLLSAAPASGQSRYESAVHIGTVDSVWSATLEEHRPYLVYTPPSYDDPTLAPARYPVLYLLDGDAHFHSVSGLVQSLGTGVNAAYAIPEMIVVAIPNTNRTRDLTPTHALTGPDGEEQEGFEESGGNPAFFRFLRDELVPRVEADYRAADYRILVGHSFGGITALNALFEMPELFDAYVAIDPSLWWDGGALLDRAREVFASSDLTGKALFVSQANTVTADDPLTDGHFLAITRFDAVMDTHDRSGVRYGFRYYADDDHGTVPLVSEYDALRFIFDGYRVPLGTVLADPSHLTEHFRRASARIGAPFGPPESMIRALAGAALQWVDADKAVHLGELRTELFPESWDAHRFLGDLWAQEGDSTRARGHYRNALERKPGDPDLLRKLEEVGGGGR